MPLDYDIANFSLLSMSELRNQPGEILSRVADDGEAFIIERNGKRKACLVPLSFFFPDIAPDRIAQEIRILIDHNEEVRPTITDKRDLAFQHEHKLNDGSTVKIKILLPHGYPHSCPRVYAEPIQDGVPHRWSDGALCLYGVMTGWNPGKDTVNSTLQLARRWLNHYDTWRRSGTWSVSGETRNG